MARREKRIISGYMSILPVWPLARPSHPLDRLAAEGGEQRSQTGWIGVQEWVVILARALSSLETLDRFPNGLRLLLVQRELERRLERGTSFVGSIESLEKRGKVQ